MMNDFDSSYLLCERAKKALKSLNINSLSELKDYDLRNFIYRSGFGKATMWNLLEYMAINGIDRKAECPEELR